MGRIRERAAAAALFAASLAGALYVAGVAAFVAMLWTLLQVALWAFGG